MQQLSSEEEAQLARKNRRLGLILFGVVILVIIAFMYQFTMRGLPKDPNIFRQIHQERSAAAQESKLATPQESVKDSTPEEKE